MGDTVESGGEVVEEAVRCQCRQLIEMAPFPMAVVAGPGHAVVCANVRFGYLFGSSKEALVGMPLGALLDEPGAGLKIFREALVGGVSKVHRETSAERALGLGRSYVVWPIAGDALPEGMVVQITASEIEEKTLAMNEALLLGSLRQQGLTEASEAAKVLMEALVHERTAELMEINKQLESFVYAVAHDLRAPLRAMQGFSALLAADVGAGISVKARDCAARIRKAAEFMDALLIDLLTFSRISQQRLPLSRVELGRVVEAVLGRMVEEIRGGKVRVEHEGPWPGVLAHESSLHQMIFNLVSNALKFSRPGVQPELRLRAEARPGYVRLWVEDNGIGISPGHQSQIFLPFTRLHGGKYAGTGIGLAIVQKGAERMGGAVGVESAEGLGSRFWIDMKSAPDTGEERVEQSVE